MHGCLVSCGDGGTLLSSTPSPLLSRNVGLLPQREHEKPSGHRRWIQYARHDDFDAHLIDVEVNIAGGLPQFSVVGLPDATVRESRDQVRSALKNTGFHFSAKKITVNLAPAGIKKEGSGATWLLPLGFSSRKK